MKQLDPMVFVAVFQEMLGGLFWPLVVFIVFGALAFIAVIIRDRGINSHWLVRAEFVALLGGFAGIGLMLWVTASSPGDLLGGPIDWLLAAGIWIAGATGAAIVSYVGMSLAHHARR
jgi:hypothetical protein